MVAMQRALAEVPAGIVLAVAATAPIGTMLLLAVCDQVFPRRRAVFGGCLAVAGVVALHLL
jgi:drug/metabolite transporter (DMT)-like permease